MTVHEKVMGRREFTKDFFNLAIKGFTIGAILSTMKDNINLPRIFPDSIERTIGEQAVPIPNSWYKTLEKVSIGDFTLSKQDIDTLTKEMTPIPYEQVCKSNLNNVIATTKFGMSLSEAMDRVGVNYSSSRSLVRIDSTDGYTLVDYINNIYFSISKTNIPEKYWHWKEFEQARNARLTYSACFIPQENPTKKAEAWKVPSDVSSIWFPEEEVKPGTYFRGPDNNIIKSENYNVGMDLENLVLTVNEGNDMRRIPYYDFEGLTDKDNNGVPYISIEDFLKFIGFEQEGRGLEFYANNYVVSIPPWRQANLRIIFDERYEKKYRVPTKLVGGEFLNKAAQIGGFYKIDVIPMPIENF